MNFKMNKQTGLGLLLGAFQLGLFVVGALDKKEKENKFINESADKAAEIVMEQLSKNKN